MPEPLEFWLQLPVRNDWRTIDLVRSSVQNCVAAMLVNASELPDIGMVSAELLENAVKYGDWRGHGSFRIEIKGTDESATVVVENPVADADGHAANVFEILAWIRSFPSAEDAYRARILEIATSDSGGSGLGLIRVAYEASATLDAELDGGVLRIRATIASATRTTA